MPLLRSKLLSDAGFDHAFPTRDCVEGALLGALRSDTIIRANQVHGARAVEAHAACGAEADAVVGRGGGARIAVGVRVADCVPILLGDAQTGDVAAVHAGWRGVVAGVVRAGVELVGGRAIFAAIGPCIGACCFEVGRDVADRIAGASDGARVLVYEEADKAYVDLRVAIRAQLRMVAVGDARIDEVAGCTKHEPERFHSYRRDGARSGRMLAAIASR